MLLIADIVIWAPLAAALIVMFTDPKDADANISVFDAMAAVEGHSEQTYI